MSNLRIFDPVVNDPFESMFRRFLSPIRMEMDNGALEMRVDVTEIDGMYKVRADIPGAKKDDINVRIDGNLIQIDAEMKRQKETKESGGKVLRSERWEGAVSRAFTVAQDVDESKVSAKYEDGVLTLELPKKATSTAKKITIQ